MIPRASITAWRRTAPWADDAHQVEATMAAKMADAAFLGDITPLLRTGVTYDPIEAWRRVHETIIACLPGDPWKGAFDRHPSRAS